MTFPPAAPPHPSPPSHPKEQHQQEAGGCHRGPPTAQHGTAHAALPAWGPSSRRGGSFYWDAISRVFPQPAFDLHSIPGPPPTSWLLGNIPDVDREDYHLQALQWAEQYGAICKFRLAFQYVLLVTDPQVAAQVLGRGPLALPRKSIGYAFFDLATNNFGGTSFFTTTNERHWQAVRKATAPAFSHSNIRAVFPVAMKHAECLAEQLGAAAAGQGSGRGQGVEVQEGLEHMLLAVFLEGLYRIPPEQLPCSTLAAGLNLLLEEANCRIRFPFRGPLLRLIDPQRRRQVAAAQEALGSIYGRIVDTFLQRAPPPEDDTSLWACLARMRDPDTGQPLTKEQLVPDVGVLIVAGYDTSSHTIAWTLRLIAEHPEVQRRIHQELREAGLLRLPQRPPTTTPAACDGSCGAPNCTRSNRQAAPSGVKGVAESGGSFSVNGKQTCVDVGACLPPAGTCPVPAGRQRDSVPHEGLPSAEALDVTGGADDCSSRSGSGSSGNGGTRRVGASSQGGGSTAEEPAGSGSSGSSSSSSSDGSSSDGSSRGSGGRGDESCDGTGSSDGSSTSGQEVTLEHLGALTYLNCVVDESMRLFPVAATASVRETAEACRVGPYRVPKGTMVWPMVFALHRSAALWDRPHDFVPERWLQPGAAYCSSPSSATASGTGTSTTGNQGLAPGSSGGSSSSPGQRVRRFMPFSDGLKGCMGQALGLLEVRATLVAILSRFWLQLPPPPTPTTAAATTTISSTSTTDSAAASSSSSSSSNQAGGRRAGEAAMLMALTLKMRDGLRLQLTPHGQR